MRDFANITTARAGRDTVRITVNVTQGGQSVQLGFNYDQVTTANLVKALCRDAGLPEPWKKG